MLSELSDEGLESEDDLEGTGLLGSENSEGDQEDSGIEDNQDQHDQQDVKPLILAPITFDAK